MFEVSFEGSIAIVDFNPETSLSLRFGTSSTSMLENFQSEIPRKKILFNMSNVTEIDSSGLSAFLVLNNKVLKENGEIAFFGFNEKLTEQANTLGLDIAFKICAEKQEAIRILKEG